MYFILTNTLNTIVEYKGEAEAKANIFSYS